MSGQLDKSSQFDSSQILVEVQLKLIYYLETVFAFVRARAASALNECARAFSVYFGDSFLYSTIFKCKTYFLNNTVRRKRLLDWLHHKLRPPFTPANFTTDWTDGIRLCALCEVISPGACPRYDLLSPANALSNIKLALSLIEAYLNVKPGITAKEIRDCSSEAKLVHLLSQIKISYAKKIIKSTGTSWLKLHQPAAVNGDAKALAVMPPVCSEFFFNRCFVKGMGLISGVRSRRARFSIYYYEPLPQISLIFEIVGPNESFCSEKVVAELANSDTDDDDAVAERKSQEHVQSCIMRAAMQRKATDKNLKIPFFYKIFSDHILVTYIPLFTGDHVISIIWQGQHVLNSPYTVSIEESEYLESDLSDIGPKFEPGFQYPLCLLKSQKDRRIDEMGRVMSKKVLKKSIISNGKEYEYNNYFESNFSPNFTNHPPDPHVVDVKFHTSTSLDESSEVRSVSPPPPSLPNSEKSRSRKDSVDSGISQESIKASTSSKPNGKERKTIVKTKIVERKISYETSKVKITEKVHRKSGDAELTDKLTIPQIKVSPADEQNEIDNLSPCPSPGVRTPSLKEMIGEAGKDFDKSIEKLRKTLEHKLTRHKAQLESSV